MNITELRKDLKAAEKAIEDARAKLDAADADTVTDAELEEIERNLNAAIERRSKTLADIEAVQRRIEERKKTINEVISKADGDAKEFRFVDQAVEYTAKSPEYRTAWLKTLNPGLGELTETEKRAYTHMTTNTDAVIPHMIGEKIWDTVNNKYALLNDLTVKQFNGIYEFIRRKGITAGDAYEHTEGATVTEEQNDLEKIPVVAKAFVKNLRLSDQLKATSIDAFENWIVTEIAQRIGVAMNKYVVAQVQAKIDAKAKITAKAATPTFAEIAQLMGAVETDGTVAIYANRKTIYNGLIAVSDTTGRPIFTHNAIDKAAGTLLGVPVKEDPTIADNIVLCGAASDIEANMPEPLNVETDRDLTNRTTIYSGFAMLGAELANTVGFAQLTLTSKG